MSPSIAGKSIHFRPTRCSSRRIYDSHDSVQIYLDGLYMKEKSQTETCNISSSSTRTSRTQFFRRTALIEDECRRNFLSCGTSTIVPATLYLSTTAVCFISHRPIRPAYFASRQAIAIQFLFDSVLTRAMPSHPTPAWRLSRTYTTTTPINETSTPALRSSELE